MFCFITDQILPDHDTLLGEIFMGYRWEDGFQNRGVFTFTKILFFITMDIMVDAGLHLYPKKKKAIFNRHHYKSDSFNDILQLSLSDERNGGEGGGGGRGYWQVFLSLSEYIYE